MNELIRKLCKGTDFSNLLFVIMKEDGKIVSVGNKIESDLAEMLDGKNWFDFVADEDKERVKEEYNYVIINKKFCHEMVYHMHNCPPARWIVSYVNNEYRFIVSIGVLLNQVDFEYEKVRQFYAAEIQRDREMITELGGFS